MSRERSAIRAGGFVGELGGSRPTPHPVLCRISRGRFSDGKRARWGTLEVLSYRPVGSARSTETAGPRCSANALGVAFAIGSILRM